MVKLTDVHVESGLVGIDMETTYFVKTAEHLQLLPWLQARQMEYC